MSRAWFSKLSLEQRLALAALMLGGLALFARTDGGNVVRLDVKELAGIVEREEDHVTPLELADWILARRADYRLIDVRSDTEYAEYHIPTAENVPVGSLPDAALLRNETIVLYSDGGIHAYQAWLLLRAKGYRSVYTLRGGLEQWKEDVLFPVFAENASPDEQARIAKLREVSRFFGGKPRSGDEAPAAAIALELPRVDLGAAVGVVPRQGKKKKEGC